VTDGRWPVSSARAPAPRGPYSQAIRVGNLLFLAGQGPFDETGRRVGETVGEQTRRALENLDVVARAGGGSRQNAGRVGVYVRNLESFAEINATYREFFREPFPARTTVQSNLIGFDVEIDAIVWLGS
jgi:reactive intermediate/imine deaminase